MQVITSDVLHISQCSSAIALPGNVGTHEINKKSERESKNGTVRLSKTFLKLVEVLPVTDADASYDILL